ncbi:MAG TPA: hypothetical protein VNR00_10950 [Opitutus sp.]|nr:hypothetical protein [Opitutus sp.]
MTTSRILLMGRQVARAMSLLVLACGLGSVNGTAMPLVLENAVVRVVIDPAVGRVMEFAPKTRGPEKERNLLWTNRAEEIGKEAAQAGYRNWGGDKVWPVAQPFWRFAIGRIWPPDTATDGVSAEAERVSPLEARLVFSTSEAFGSRLTREFALSPTHAVLVIRNIIEQMKPSPFPAQAWSITQVPLPERVVLDVAKDVAPGVEQPVNLNGIRELGPRAFLGDTVATGSGWASMRPTREGQQKFGTLGRWIAGVWSDGMLVQRVALDAQGMYPEATSLQFYYSGPYGELETLGPARLLRVGETLTTTVVWQWLEKIDPSLDDAGVAGAVEAAESELRRAGVDVPAAMTRPTEFTLKKTSR